MRRSFLTRFASFLNPTDPPASDTLESRTDDRPNPGRSSNLNSQSFSSDGGLFGPLTVYSHRAMACDFEISLNETDAAQEEVLDVFDLIDREEESLSVFKPTSLLSRINMLAAEMNVRVPSDLFEQLKICRSLWEETDGAFDITSSVLWKLWGFAKGEGRVPTDREISVALKRVGMHHLILNEENQTIAFDLPGIEINFGAIGKGFALDRAASFLAESPLENYLIHGGMSSALARGGRVEDRIQSRDGSFRRCWSIGVADPIEPEQRLATLRLVDEAIGTAGSGRQYFFHQGKRFSHIINPKTGRPATGILSATVIAPDATRADALSTACFVMGVEATEKFAKKHPDYRILLVLETGVGKREIVTLNMDDSHFLL